MIVCDGVGKQWVIIEPKDIHVGNLISISRTKSIKDSGWPSFHKARNYSVKVIAKSKNTIVMNGVGYPLDDQYTYFKLQEYEPYDHNQEPEEDCL